MRKRIFLTILCLLFAGFALAQNEAKGAYDDLARKVEKKIQNDKKTNIEELKVTNDQGTIYIEGVARIYGSKYRAEELARKVEGVKDVKNSIALTASQMDDVDIAGQVSSKIRSHMTGSPFDFIAVEVHSGFVVLMGNVRDQSLVGDSMQAAIWVPGVRGVENKIEYASIAAGDERLRQAVFTRIRREFPQYFVGKDPAILIVVNQSRVKLIGSIESAVSRQKIGSIVTSIPGVLSVENLIQAQ